VQDYPNSDPMSSYCRQKRDDSLYNLAGVGSCRTNWQTFEVAPSAVDRVHTSRPSTAAATDVTQLSWKFEYCSVLGNGGGEVELSRAAPSG
jgi:hypothetical protein